MNTSPAGIAFIRAHEGARNDAYQDAVGIWTIGVGHTGREVVEGLRWTAEEIDAVLAQDLGHCEEAIAEHCFAELTQNQFDALVSLIFNIGVQAFRNSTLLVMLNQGKYEAAAHQFRRWDRAGGKELAGLLKRRNDESALFEA